MATIRIPEDRWAEVWFALVASGPVSRLSQEPVYVVSDQQVKMLRRRKLPFEVIPDSDGAWKEKDKRG
ncbi:MAG: hypothetical protein L0215_01555 [Gemmataceae bacterium]|nr:hypothetical protein [Gemmataceae bacterium]